MVLQNNMFIFEYDLLDTTSIGNYGDHNDFIGYVAAREGKGKSMSKA